MPAVSPFDIATKGSWRLFILCQKNIRHVRLIPGISQINYQGQPYSLPEQMTK
jgi:hypothetical protein